MQLPVCLAQGPENLWQFKLLKWIFICIHHVFTFMAGPASVSLPQNGTEMSTMLTTWRPLPRQKNWLTFDNRSCLCKYANHWRDPPHTHTHVHTPALEQSREQVDHVGGATHLYAMLITWSYLKADQTRRRNCLELHISETRGVCCHNLA